MAFIHVAKREIHCKIVYYGPGLGGKTTNLQALCRQVPRERRGELTSLTADGERTLYFDLLPLDLGRVGNWETRFHLYTVPGQSRYNVSRRIVLQGVDAVVFVADSDPVRFFENRRSFDNLRENLALVGRPLGDIGLLLQYNKRDLPGAVPMERLDTLINAGGHPVIGSVASQGIGVRETVRAAIEMVLARLAPARHAAPVVEARSAAGGFKPRSAGSGFAARTRSERR
ncbi:MAG: gliding-motility protein MglA [Candidatus Eisenbacteria bacterium]